MSRGMRDAKVGMSSHQFGGDIYGLCGVVYREDRAVLCWAYPQVAQQCG